METSSQNKQYETEEDADNKRRVIHALKLAFTAGLVEAEGNEVDVVGLHLVQRSRVNHLFQASLHAILFTALPWLWLIYVMVDHIALQHTVVAYILVTKQ